MSLNQSSNQISEFKSKFKPFLNYFHAWAEAHLFLSFFYFPQPARSFSFLSARPARFSRRPGLPGLTAARLSPENGPRPRALGPDRVARLASPCQPPEPPPLFR